MQRTRWAPGEACGFCPFLLGTSVKNIPLNLPREKGLPPPGLRGLRLFLKQNLGWTCRRGSTASLVVRSRVSRRHLVPKRSLAVMPRPEGLQVRLMGCNRRPRTDLFSQAESPLRALAPAASFRGPQSYRFAFGQKIWHTIFFSPKPNFKIPSLSRHRAACLASHAGLDSPNTQRCFFKRMCCHFVVEPKDGVDDRKFSLSERTDRK